MRKVFYKVSVILLLLICFYSLIWPKILYSLVVVVPIIFVGLMDLNSRHNVLRNYPVLGHIRYLAEFIRPEIQQYFIASNLSGRPFNREERSLVYQRGKEVQDTIPFGTQHDLTKPGNSTLYHSLDPKVVPESASRTTVGGPECQQPYHCSRLNISGMSYGALGKNAILALNKGAKEGGFAQNTGEGGIAPFHLEHDGDLIWQIGTGYFGCRTRTGHFDAEMFKEKAQMPNVKMIEIKLSQGAKPAHGGLLLGEKVTKEIAKIRGIEEGETCISPPSHSAFGTPLELLEFIVQLRQLSGGKPVGFKLCIGIKSEFMAICKAMLETGITPDFITVDGAEGGTGAAPVEFSNYVGMPINEALTFVENCLQGIELRDRIKVLASGKVSSGFGMVKKIALGADVCMSARAMMFTIGCIQALSCHNNRCPTGVATQDSERQKALIVDHKYKHVANYHKATLHSFRELVGAIGLAHPNELRPEHIHRRITHDTTQSFAELFYHISPGDLLGEHIHPLYARDWAKADPKQF